MLFVHATSYRGDDLPTAWNSYGVRIADLASEHRQTMLAMQVSPGDLCRVPAPTGGHQAFEFQGSGPGTRRSVL